MITSPDGAERFGWSCSISNELVVIGASGANLFTGEAYLFSLDGTELSKLEPGDDGESFHTFGESVSMDEKIVVGTQTSNYIRVFSREGIYERTIRCDDCDNFGKRVATLGDKIVTSGEQNSLEKLFIYSTEGELLNEIENEDEEAIDDIAISEQYIVSTGSSSKTIIYSNSAPDFPKLTEIDKEGDNVAVSGDKLVIGNEWAGAAYLYSIDGTLDKELESNGASSSFGESVDITDDYVVVGAPTGNSSALIFSSVTGELIETVTNPNDLSSSGFGKAVCASDSYYIVGYDNDYAGVFLFQFSS
eukprot:CAMPEP_0178947090 /NCGR_PEP_ID=MMETSP0789-20121207/4649_1 /TAXON_ID=3005 /ORGANISM="Rhizosolenia setigera, Strain CCMP 1694" /LENGTH=303 /DNA_ID=CAMNT_0020627157 /DNA_START=1319 /DNA_END=2230 /DNA_ORIENTATION=-